MPTTDRFGNERRGKMRYGRSYSSALADEIERYHAGPAKPKRVGRSYAEQVAACKGTKKV